MNDEWKFSTKLIHAGEPRPGVFGAVSFPVFQSSTYEYGGEKSYNDIRYIRLNNTPNHQVLSKKLCVLEGAEDAVVTSSGMSAITTALLAIVGPGEHLLVQDQLYGGTYDFLKKDFPKFGREVTFIPSSELANSEVHVRPNTKAIYVESVSNPLLKVPDFKSIIEFTKKKKLVSLIDNTFPSPANFNPISLGFDLVLHSATKYLNGHSDIVGGAIVGGHKWVRESVILLNHLGGSMDPHTCFLLHRGLKTLEVRVKHQNQTAMKLARALEKQKNVRKVYYPGLESHPDHARAKQYFRDFGAVVSFELGESGEEADRFLSRLKIPYVAPSLGGIETLVTRPATTSHSGMGRDDREKFGIRENLIRVSVGLEDAEDLIQDFVGNIN